MSNETPQSSNGGASDADDCSWDKLLSPLSRKALSLQSVYSKSADKSSMEPERPGDESLIPPSIQLSSTRTGTGLLPMCGKRSGSKDPASPCVVVTRTKKSSELGTSFRMYSANSSCSKWRK